MLTINSANIASFDTPTLLAFYNANSGVNSIKRFSDRKSAEKRVLALVEYLSTLETKKSARLFPEGFGSIFDPVFSAKSVELFADYSNGLKVVIGWNKVDTSTEDLRSFEDRTKGFTAPIHKFSDIFPDAKVGESDREESEEEEAARIEAEAAAEAENTPSKASKASAKGRRSNSEGVAVSWLDKEVRAARLIRDGVSVTVNGVTSVYRSTREGFRANRLPDSQHIRFRLKLKASRKEVFEFEGVSYLFEILGE